MSYQVQVLPQVEMPLCPVEPAALIVGQKWTLQLVYFLLDGRSMRFCGRCKTDWAASIPAH